MVIVPYKAANVWRAERFLLVEALDDWGTSYTSESGWCIVCQPDPTPAWLGKNVRKAIETSYWADTYHMTRSDYDEQFPSFHERSISRENAIWESIVRDYRYKDKQTARRHAKMVFVEWMPTQWKEVKLSASKPIRGGGHQAWPTSKSEGKVLHVDINAPSGVLGLAVLDALSRCD